MKNDFSNECGLGFENMKTLEERITRIEDIIAIHDLKARYGRMCNDDHNYNLIDTIFAPNIKWEGDPDDPWGAAEGREASIKLFKGFQKQMDGRCLGHNITNGCITFIDNTHAKGHWHLFGAYRSGDESKGQGTGFLEQGYYDDDYVKIDGKWYIETLRFKDNLVADPSVGWKDKLIQEF